MKISIITHGIRSLVIYSMNGVFMFIARQFGYPERPGMLRYVFYDGSYFFKKQLEKKHFDAHGIPYRKIPIPPREEPQHFIEVLLGCIPKATPIERLYVENKYEGYYAFMIKSHTNLIFLPTKLSEYIQIHLNYCLDLSDLELLRQGLFVAVITFGQIVLTRYFLGWIITINPYRFPWNLFISLVDWTEDASDSFVPTIFGVNLTGTALMTIIGLMGDFLNNLVFTMPYLPGEGDPQFTFFKGQTCRVWVYHFLPVLWYKYPIPNEIREFWYYERPDILQYMQTAYSKLEIQFLPDQIVEHLNQVS